MLDIILSRVQGDTYSRLSNQCQHCCQIGNESISTYRPNDVFLPLKVHSHIDNYNFTDNTLGGRFDMPKEMANSHLRMVIAGRYIYLVMDNMVLNVGDLQQHIHIGLDDKSMAGLSA